MSLRAAPKLIANLWSHNGTARKHIRGILKIGKLDALYKNILAGTVIVNEDIICFDIYRESVPSSL